MKTLTLAFLLAFTLLPAARAEEARFFRMAGPAVSTITGFSADGYVTWISELTNGAFTVQTTWLLAGPSNWVEYIQVPVTNQVSTRRLFDLRPPAHTAFIPAGSFQMGDNLDSDAAARPIHTVTVSAFYMDKFEVTKELWDRVKTWAITNGYRFDNAGSGKALNHPVQSVSWYDVVKWCNARSQTEGRAPAYYRDAALTQVYKTGQVAPRVNWSSGYRLPTEAEWEKAARGGGSGHRFPWSNVETISHSHANYNSSTSYAYDVSPTRGLHPTFNDGVEPHTSPVGYFAPNGYGLYDMTGNVAELCWDWSGSYSSGSQTDPRGPAAGELRVNRGASCDSSAEHCRSARRGGFYPSEGLNRIGFRCVLPP